MAGFPYQNHGVCQVSQGQCGNFAVKGGRKPALFAGDAAPAEYVRTGDMAAAAIFTAGLDFFANPGLHIPAKQKQ
jgi:hypothetical protein